MPDTVSIGSAAVTNTATDHEARTMENWLHLIALLPLIGIGAILIGALGYLAWMDFRHTED